MSLIGKNIKKIRMVKKMSQLEFARLFNVARPSVGAYEEGRAEPKIDTVILIANEFGISIDALLTREITINELLKFSILDKKQIKIRDSDKTISSTPYISDHLLFDYIVHFKNRDFINELPHIRIPGMQSKKSRAFQVTGSEMKRDHYGIQHKDILVCSGVDLSTTQLIPEKTYVLVHPEGIGPKRFVKKEEQLIFSHDNPAYENFAVRQENLLECWKPEFIISSSIPVLPAIESRVDELEHQLKTLIEKMTGNKSD